MFSNLNVTPCIPFSPYPCLPFPPFFSRLTCLYLPHSVITQKTECIFKELTLLVLCLGWFIVTNKEKMHLFCSVLKAQWVPRRCLLERQCESGKSGSRSCCLPRQDLVLGWRAVCTYTLHLAALCHLLFATLWCYQDKWPLGNGMQWNDRLNLNVFELKRKK